MVSQNSSQNRKKRGKRLILRQNGREAFGMEPKIRLKTNKILRQIFFEFLSPDRADLETEFCLKILSQNHWSSREENVELIYNKYKFELHLFKNIEMSTSKSKSTRKVKINTEEKSSLLITSNSSANSSKTKKSINSSILSEVEQKLWLKNKTEIVLLQNMLIVSAGVEISEMNTSSLITQVSTKL